MFVFPTVSTDLKLGDTEYKRAKNNYQGKQRNSTSFCDTEKLAVVSPFSKFSYFYQCLCYFPCFKFMRKVNKDVLYYMLFLILQYDVVYFNLWNVKTNTLTIFTIIILSLFDWMMSCEEIVCISFYSLSISIHFNMTWDIL